MTIKEVEERTGMTRANVRFYEQEGLLAPGRTENGYRDYSEEDVETLKRIKLLRNIHMSLDGIKEVHQGKRPLTEALEDLLTELEKEKAGIESSHLVCRAICDDRVPYASLNAGYYLERMETETQEPVVAPATDVVPGKGIPVRRFFARTMDFAICGLCWKLILALVFHANIADRGFAGMVLDIAAAYGIMLLAEPLLLAYLGTTPGKRILGIRVQHPDDRRLTWSEAFYRTRTVCLWGMGLSIPLFDLYRNWKSYDDCREGRALVWEEDSVVSLKDEQVRRTVAYIVLSAMLLAVSAAAVLLSALPLKRGDLTVAQFCRNYNHYADYYGVDRTYLLDEDGKWVKKEEAGQGVVIELGNMPQPKFIFTESNGQMTGMEFTVKVENNDFPVTNYAAVRALAVSSFVKAQDSYRVFSAKENRLIDRMAQDSFESYSLEACGISVECEIEYSGYADPGGLYLIPQQGGPNSYSIHFKMRKTMR